MKEVKRTAPRPEWVQMYRKARPSAEDRVRSRRREKHGPLPPPHRGPGRPIHPGRHNAAGGAPVQTSGAGLRNVEDLIALYKTEGRHPSPTGPPPRKRTLAHGSRQPLSPTQRDRQRPTAEPRRVAASNAQRFKALTSIAVQRARASPPPCGQRLKTPSFGPGPDAGWPSCCQENVRPREPGCV